MTTVARVNKKFGSEGEVMLSLYADFPEEFDPQQDALLVEIDGLMVPLYCDRFERRGRTGALVRFADLESERRVEELLGRELAMELEEEERDEDEFYLEDLIGFSVELSEVGAKENFRGELTDFYDSEANPLFEVQVEERSLLIPAAEEFIAGIDFEGRQVKFILPEGLMNL
jgi:16S rRNA processing protein RimM